MLSEKLRSLREQKKTELTHCNLMIYLLLFKNKGLRGILSFNTLFLLRDISHTELFSSSTIH